VTFSLRRALQSDAGRRYIGRLANGKCHDTILKEPLQRHKLIAAGQKIGKGGGSDGRADRRAFE
jgi:hypothetical protein